ncbi:hypothetical protein ACM66B_005714 [Microbotryomycetes sp. NB124-2]
MAGFAPPSAKPVFDYALHKSSNHQQPRRASHQAAEAVTDVDNRQRSLTPEPLLRGQTYDAELGLWIASDATQTTTRAAAGAATARGLRRASDSTSVSSDHRTEHVRPTALGEASNEKLTGSKQSRPRQCSATPPATAMGRLSTRLSFAKLKMDNGWLKHNLSEVEHLHFRTFNMQAQARARAREQEHDNGVARRESNANKPDELFVLTADSPIDYSGQDNGRTSQKNEAAENRPSQAALGKRKEKASSAAAPAPRPTSRKSSASGGRNKRSRTQEPDSDSNAQESTSAEATTSTEATATSSTLRPMLAQSYDDFWAGISMSSLAAGQQATDQSRELGSTASDWLGARARDSSGPYFAQTLAAAPHVPSTVAKQYSQYSFADNRSPSSNDHATSHSTNTSSKGPEGKSLGATASFSSLPPPPPLEFGPPPAATGSSRSLEELHDGGGASVQARGDNTFQQPKTFTEPKRSVYGTFRLPAPNERSRRVDGQSTTTTWSHAGGAHQEEISVEALDAMFDESQSQPEDRRMLNGQHKDCAADCAAEPPLSGSSQKSTDTVLA